MTDPSITDWIAAGSSVVSTIAVLIGLVYAYKQVGIWRTEARHQRRAAVAEDVLADAQSATDAIMSLRSPLSSIPVEKINDRTYVYEQRAERLGARATIFESLRRSQIRARAVLQDAEIDAAVDKLFTARAEFFDALQIAADYARDSDGRLTKEDVQVRKEAHRKIFGRLGQEDELHSLMQSALHALDTRLGPIIRLDDL